MSDPWYRICLFSILFTIGVIMGVSSGRGQACESVKLEWVSDQKKCMKVTKESV